MPSFANPQRTSKHSLWPNYVLASIAGFLLYAITPVLTFCLFGLNQKSFGYGGMDVCGANTYFALFLLPLLVAILIVLFFRLRKIKQIQSSDFRESLFTVLGLLAASVVLVIFGLGYRYIKHESAASNRALPKSASCDNLDAMACKSNPSCMGVYGAPIYNPETKIVYYEFSNFVCERFEESTKNANAKWKEKCDLLGQTWTWLPDGKTGWCNAAD